MRRTLRPLAALALVALIITGCANAPAETGADSSGGDTTPPASAVSSATGTATGSSGGNTAAPRSASAGTAATQNAPAVPTATETPIPTPSGTNTAATAPAGDGSGASNAAATRQQAVKFAECMRANGAKQFPDPDASGQLTIDAIANGSSLDTNSAAFKQAIGACKDLEPSGFTGGKRSPEQQAAALKFARCIRDNGVKDFPDPAPDSPLVDTDRIPSAARNGGMSMLNAAMRKCGDSAAAAGVTGGK